MMQNETLVSVTGSNRSAVEVDADFLRACDQAWPTGQPAPGVYTRAPGRLDCMGGMADFSGALALQYPIDRKVHVAAGKREDQRIYVESIGWQQDGESAVHEWPLSLFYQTDGQIVTPEEFLKQFDACPWVRHVAGVCLALLESGEMQHFAGGVTIVLKSDIPVKAGLASSAALQVAVARAITSLFDIEMDGRHLARHCRAANAEISPASSALVDHLTCLFGETDTLLQIRCQPDDVLGTLSLPNDVTIVGIDAGLRTPIYEERYTDNRTSSLIGRFLIERILKTSGAVGDPTGGYLANITPNEYVQRFRNELPVKLRGELFLDSFGRPDELDAQIEPSKTYKIRSRTEHHIYENDRTHRFMERLARARRTGERDALVEAGELMYASHWSYGQRCGMGSIETDALVNFIRERGAARGLYGAKVTGGGCGGTVAVLIAKNPAARTALEEVCDAYAKKSGKSPAILLGSCDGALAYGEHRP